MAKKITPKRALVTVELDCLIVMDPDGQAQLRLPLDSRVISELGLTIALLEQINEETQQRLDLATKELLEERGRLNALLADTDQ